MSLPMTSTLVVRSKRPAGLGEERRGRGRASVSESPSVNVSA